MATGQSSNNDGVFAAANVMNDGGAGGSGGAGNTGSTANIAASSAGNMAAQQSAVRTLMQAAETVEDTGLQGFRGVLKRDVPKFYGRPGEKVDEFLYHYEAFWELDPVFGRKFMERAQKGDYFTRQDELQKVDYLVGGLKVALHGPACEDLRVYLNTHPGASYHQVRLWLLDQYDNVLEKSAAAAEIIGTKIKTGETLDAYTERFTQLARQAGMATTGDNAVAMSIYSFGLGVERLTAQVLMKEPKNMHEAHRAARTSLATERSVRDEFERLIGRPYDTGLPSQYLGYPMPVPQEYGDYGSSYGTPNPMQRQLDMIQQQLQRLEFQQQPGTQSYQSPRANQRPAYAYQSGQYNDGRRGTGGPEYDQGGANRKPSGRCNNCGQFGHYSRECRLFNHHDPQPTTQTGQRAPYPQRDQQNAAGNQPTQQQGDMDRRGQNAEPSGKANPA